MQQNPFNNNPLTRGRVFPNVSFVKPNEAKGLKLPVPDPYDPNKLPSNDMPVPNQLPDPTKTFSNGLIQYDNSPLAKDEWTKWRFKTFNSSCGNWGDAWGKTDMTRELEIDRKSAEFAKKSEIGNAKLSAELEKDDFRKQLLADIDSGKLFPNTRLEEVDESKRSTISQQTTIKENTNGSNSNK